MTPKEKAEDLLYNSFENLMYDAVENTYARERLAKQCALIAVDEIIKETKLHDKTIYEHVRTGYWIDVKKEIEKL